MRILVIGAGVLGSYLAHVLVRGRHDVTVLARGKRLEQLQQDGLVIRHYFQRSTTVDQVRVISSLQPDDRYDLIFAVMKFNDFHAILPVLAENASRHIVLVGNNADAPGMHDAFLEMSAADKQVMFGFQISGGVREASGRIICIRGGGRMILGSLNGDLPLKPFLDDAFSQTRYKLAYHGDIDAWLKSHIVTIAALSSVHYLHDGQLRRAYNDKKLVQLAISAMDDGFRILEGLGYTVTPASQVPLIRKYRSLVYYGLITIHRMPFMRFVDGAFSEIAALFDSFRELKLQAGVETPHWDELERISLAKYHHSVS